MVTFVCKIMPKEIFPHSPYLVTEGREGLGRLGLGGSVLLGLGQLSCSSLLALVVSQRLGLSAVLQTRHNILVLPAVLVAQAADGAVLATGLQAEDTEGLGNDHLLLLVVGRGNTLEDLEALESGGTTGSLVGNHATDGLVEDAGGSAEVEGTTTSGVVSGDLAHVGGKLELSAEELARDVEGLGADNNDLLTVKELLGHNAGKTTKEVTLAVDDDNRLEGRHLARWFSLEKERIKREGIKNTALPVGLQTLKPSGENLLLCFALLLGG